MNRHQASGIRLQAIGSRLWTLGSRLPKTALLFLLRGYKFAVSPMFPAACRYVPTCSEYAQEAVEIHGALRGSALAIWRVLRCHPFVRGGYDPVPNESLSLLENGASLRRTGEGARPHAVLHSH